MKFIPIDDNLENESDFTPYEIKNKFSEAQKNININCKRKK